MSRNRTECSVQPLQHRPGRRARTLFAGAMLAAVMTLLPVTAAAELSPAIQADLYLVQTDEYLKEKDYAAAREAMEKLIELAEEHNLTLPVEFHFRYAQVLNLAGEYVEAGEALHRYLESAGQTGAHYREALTLLTLLHDVQAARAEEAAWAARAAAEEAAAESAWRAARAEEEARAAREKEEKEEKEEKAAAAESAWMAARAEEEAGAARVEEAAWAARAEEAASEEAARAARAEEAAWAARAARAEEAAAELAAWAEEAAAEVAWRSARAARAVTEARVEEAAPEEEAAWAEEEARAARVEEAAWAARVEEAAAELAAWAEVAAAELAAWAEVAAAEVATNLKMVVVPAGSYRMGSPSSEADRYDDEGPVHRVAIAKPFAVGVYEVTFEEWDACVASGGCDGYSPSDEGWGRGRRPVINVSWNDAQRFVAWLRQVTGDEYRLLSEAEWEYVARAGTSTPFHTGSTIAKSQANYDSSRGFAVPVGSFSPNAFGLYDVHGNVWEWVQDCWNDSYRGAPGDGSAWERGDCGRRVLRGGSWFDAPSLLRSALRYWDDPGDRRSGGGFRVARTLGS